MTSAIEQNMLCLIIQNRIVIGNKHVCNLSIQLSYGKGMKYLQMYKQINKHRVWPKKKLVKRGKKV